MEIIIHRYGSICEPDLIDAFRSCGITVIEDSREIYQKSISREERIRDLGSLILTHQASFVFSINFFPYISEICERMKLLYVSLIVDCPVLELFSNSIKNGCNRIFLFDHMQYQRFYPENPECIYYLPLAANTDRWDKILECVTAEDENKYQCEISFVGSLYKEKSPLSRICLDKIHDESAKRLIEEQLKGEGDLFFDKRIPESLVDAIRCKDASFFRVENAFQDTDEYVAANYYLGMQASCLERIRTLTELGREFQVDLYTKSDTSDLAHIPKIRCRGEAATHYEMPKVFYFSKINLNITMYSIQSGLSQRIWDVLGCGGFLLTDYQSEIPEYFTIGKDLDCFENVMELKEKAAYYLAHEDIRKDIANNGFQKVRAGHTYIHRICYIFNILFGCGHML